MILVQPLTTEAFAPFGQVFTAPHHPGRTGPLANLENSRLTAKGVLSMTCAEPATSPLSVTKLERHPYSSQAFIPLDLAGFLIVVAPKLDNGAPDLNGARAFRGTGEQGFNYEPDVWHSGFAVLERVGRYVVLIWRDGTSNDEVFADLDQPIRIAFR